MGKSTQKPQGRRSGGARIVLLWTLVPLVLIASIELVARRLEASSKTRLQWYQGALDRMATGAVDYIFLGTSRTASGLVPSAWEAEIEEATNRGVVCLNLGRAYSGPVANYFGLRELLRRYPEKMRGCTVFIEMSAGLPAFTGDWNERWFFEGNQQLIVDYMRRSDLMKFLGVREHSFEDKAGIVARYVGRSSTLISARRRLQQTAEWRGMHLMRTVLRRAGARTQSPDETDLPENRQLRRDAAGIRLQRDLVLERVQPEELAAQRPLAPWDRRVICEAAAELRRSGVRVVFFEMPVPGYYWTVNATPTRQADREAFFVWARTLGIGILSNPLAVGDEDFPDLSHLRASRIEEYTRALARGFLQWDGAAWDAPAASHHIAHPLRSGEPGVALLAGDLRRLR